MDVAIRKALRGRNGRAALTPRQASVAQMMLDGLANKEIAERLAISPRTVKFHVARVLEKAGVGNRQELSARARRGEWAI